MTDEPTIEQINADLRAEVEHWKREYADAQQGGGEWYAACVRERKENADLRTEIKRLQAEAADLEHGCEIHREDARKYAIEIERLKAELAMFKGMFEHIKNPVVLKAALANGENEALHSALRSARETFAHWLKLCGKPGAPRSGFVKIAGGNIEIEINAIDHVLGSLSRAEVERLDHTLKIRRARMYDERRVLQARVKALETAMDLALSYSGFPASLRDDIDRILASSSIWTQEEIDQTKKRVDDWCEAFGIDDKPAKIDYGAKNCPGPGQYYVSCAHNPPWGPVEVTRDADGNLFVEGDSIHDSPWCYCDEWTPARSDFFCEKCGEELDFTRPCKCVREEDKIP